MKIPLIEATNKILAHLDTFKVGVPVGEQFIKEQRALVENLQSLIDTYLIEAHQREEAHKALTIAYDALRPK